MSGLSAATGGFSASSQSFWRNIPRVIAFAFGFTLLFSGMVAARTIHVDAQARNGNGTAEAPFKSISQAVAQAAPGDVVSVRSGLYKEQVKIAASGRANAPITVRGERGAVIDGASLRKGAPLVEILGSYIVFEHFQVQNSRQTGIAVFGGYEVVVRFNSILASYGAGIWVGHERRGQSARNVIEANTVYNNVRENKTRRRNSGWPPAIGVSVSDGTIIRSNRVYGNFGEGIGVLSSTKVEVTDNLVFDNFSVNIYLDNAPKTKVKQNLIGSTGNRVFFRHNRPPAGVLIANEVTRVPMPSTGILVVSNTMIGVPDVYYGTYGRNTGLHNSIIAPNQVHPARWMVPPSRSSNG